MGYEVWVRNFMGRDEDRKMSSHYTHDRAEAVMTILRCGGNDAIIKEVKALKRPNKHAWKKYV